MKFRLIASAAALALCLITVPALGASCNFGISVLGGYAWPTKSDAMVGRDGYSGPASSSFDDTWTLGAEALYRLPVGLAFGLGMQYLKLTADAARSGHSETEFANLKLIPVYALGRYTHPIHSRLSGHLEVGLGYAFSDAGKEAGLHSMEAGIGQSITIDADNSFCAFVGLGADWSLTPAWSLALDLRYWWVESDFDLKASSLGTFDKGTFQADNFQALLSLTYWFDN